LIHARRAGHTTSPRSVPHSDRVAAVVVVVVVFARSSSRTSLLAIARNIVLVSDRL